MNAPGRQFQPQQDGAKDDPFPRAQRTMNVIILTSVMTSWDRSGVR